MFGKKNTGIDLPAEKLFFKKQIKRMLLSTATLGILFACVHFGFDMYADYKTERVVERVKVQVIEQANNLYKHIKQEREQPAEEDLELKLPNNTVGNADLLPLERQKKIANMNGRDLRILRSALNSVKRGEGISSLHPSDQLAFLNMMLPVDENGKTRQSFLEKIRIAKRLGCIAIDEQMSDKIDHQIMYSSNEEEILDAIKAREQSQGANNILLREQYRHQICHGNGKI